MKVIVGGWVVVVLRVFTDTTASTTRELSIYFPTLVLFTPLAELDTLWMRIPWVGGETLSVSGGGGYLEE